MNHTQATVAGSAVVVSSGSGTLGTRIVFGDDIAAAFLAGYRPATRQAYARDLRAWAGFLESLSLDPLAAHRVHVEAFLREQESAGVAPATLARRLAAISGFYAYALDEGAIVRSPTARVRRPRVGDESPRSGLDRSEVRAVLEAAGKAALRDYALATLLVLSGLRVSEAVSADADDLGVERGHRVLRVRRKGGKRQRLALAPRTANVLDVLLDGRTGGPVFVTRTGRRLDRWGAAKVIARLGREAGLARPLSPHALRHTFATLALDAGVPLHVVQDGCGHSSPTTTRRYDGNRHSLDGAATHALAVYLGA